MTLAAVESRCLLRHPLLLAGLALSVVLLLAGARSNGAMQAMLLDGMACFPLAAGVLLAANAGGLRSRRDGTEELFAAMPSPARTRTAAQVLAVGSAVALAVGLVAAAVLAFGAADGLVVSHAGLRHVPAAAELAAGPLAVAVLGVLGVALARWVPSPFVAPPLVVGLLALEVPLDVWGSGAGARWSLPFVNAATSVPGAWVPCEPGDVVARCNLVVGFDVGGMALHLGVLAAAAGLLAFAALRPRGA